MVLNPSHSLKCLLISPQFPIHSFWNYIDACKVMGAQAPSPPLGLLTVAALLPQHWQFKLMDLNCCAFDEELWEWADIIGVGGMLPQQRGILEIITRANKTGKFIMAGGADPSSQPSLYTNADVLFVGEAEETIPLWITDLENGQPKPRYCADKKPDVTKSPVPRFDLLKLEDYVQMGVQYSRGCPFNCEFCDIIELYGRVPRTKTEAQILAELDCLYRIGYRGNVDIVDDNFIGNKRNVKRMLPHIIEWQEKHRYPFSFCTEASINLGDDIPLLELMQKTDFRVIFIGIETPDKDLLLQTQKSQNTMRPIVQRIHTIYKYGMAVTAGFILGFDNEKPGMDQRMIRLIEETAICMAMVGLLVALPNTQLTRRLKKEGRLYNADSKLVDKNSGENTAVMHSDVEKDQTAIGLNFIPTRPKTQIIQEHLNVIKTIYQPKAYMDRTLNAARLIRTKYFHFPHWWEVKRSLYGFFRLNWEMLKLPDVRWYYIRNIILLLPLGSGRMQQAIRHMGIYLHFQKHAKFIVHEMERRLSSDPLFGGDQELAQELDKKRTLPTGT